MMFPENEVKRELTERIIPFWNGLRDNEKGGFYGSVDYELSVNKAADKGCILHSRILWFYSNAYMLLKDRTLLENARHAYEFITSKCIDLQRGGIFWSVTADGVPADTQKHTYNQAFAVYALSSYYAASGDKTALDKALALYDIIETKCRDDGGYLEAFDAEWKPFANDKLSENGVMADRTMNTLLHVMEAYTELYRVSEDERVKDRLEWILGEFADRVYIPEKRQLGVFFDFDMNSLIDLHSFGHDIEAAWLIDRSCEVLGNAALTEKMSKITAALEERIYETALSDGHINNECCKGVVDTRRVWWIQAEGVVGFYNAWQKRPEKTEYFETASGLWEYIKKYIIDERSGEWFNELISEEQPDKTLEMAGEWKCPYHNGRMCIEMIRRCSAQ